ncbi:MAG: DNA polymerase III subunit delta' [Deltaproteobacteria bacterium]|nr:DNA polymerase III subunit delta' [Deltaproteobacteria bacterium]
MRWYGLTCGKPVVGIAVDMSIDFIGNENIRSKLRALADAERLHPCLLFEGPAGIGKGTTALWLAKVVNCDADEQVRPCGVCWSCRQIEKGQHPDILQIQPDETKATRVISVKQSRELIGQLALQPFHARRRFVIIDPADVMTPEAANALLKTFEDPPKATSFILVTSASASLLSTVRSRSQRIRFAPVEASSLQAWLEASGVADAAVLANLAEGCPGRARTLELDGADKWRAARDQLLDVLGADTAAQFKFAETMCRGDRSKWQAKVDTLLDATSCLLRDALSVSAGGSILYNTDRAEVIHVWAETLGPRGVAGLVQVVADTRDRLHRYVNGRLVLDTFISRFVQLLDKEHLHASI